LLHALGFRLRRRRHGHLKGKPEEQAAFRAGLEALLGEWPEDWELVFVDEATVRRHPTLTAQRKSQVYSFARAFSVRMKQLPKKSLHVVVVILHILDWFPEFSE
jgi:hypothetical protein